MVRYPKGDGFATVAIAGPAEPLVLFNPATDAERWSFTRVNDFVREPQMEIVAGNAEGEKAMRLFLPLQYDPTFKDYTVSDIIDDRIASRLPALSVARALHLRARGSGDHKEAWLTLVERDGTGWSAVLPLTTEWREFTIPLHDLAIGRSLKLPHPYPEMWWDYWCEPASGRGGAGDAVRLDRVERIQLSHRQAGGSALTERSPWIEVGPVELIFP